MNHPALPRTILLYEYCCAIGLGKAEDDPLHALYREGRMMHDAVWHDLVRAGYTVATFEIRDAEDEREAFLQAIPQADAALLIAPEFDNILLDRAEWAETKNRLGPTLDAIRLTQNKLTMACHWLQHAVPTPTTTLAREWANRHWPAVLKPIDGAGSTATYLCHSQTDFEHFFEAARAEYTGEMLLQEYVPGQAASIAFLMGPKQTLPLLPTFQTMSSDGRFHYLGAEVPIAPELAARVLNLGMRAIACVEGLQGYIGVDLILGSAEDGSDDRVLEINPRMTTSYLALSKLYEGNIADSWVRIACGL